MTPEQAAWVRKHVWTNQMRLSHKEHPGASGHCACQYGQSTRCASGVHDHCRTGGLTSCETYITSQRGYVTAFRQLYNNPTPSACGGQRGNAAQVWLADRVCRWRCPVELAKQEKAAEHRDPAPKVAEPAAVIPRRYEVVELPGFENLDLMGVA